MTKDVALAQIKDIVPSLTADDIIGLQNCTEDQLTAILKAYKSSGQVADTSIWPKVAEILKQVPDWATTGLAILKILITL